MLRLIITNVDFKHQHCLSSISVIRNMSIYNLSFYLVVVICRNIDCRPHTQPSSKVSSKLCWKKSKYKQCHSAECPSRSFPFNINACKMGLSISLTKCIIKNFRRISSLPKPCNSFI